MSTFMLLVGFTGLIIVLAAISFIYRYYEPEIRFRKYVSAFKIGAVVRAGELKVPPIEVEKYLEKVGRRARSIEAAVNEEVSRAIAPPEEPIPEPPKPTKGAG